MMVWKNDFLSSTGILGVHISFRGRTLTTKLRHQSFVEARMSFSQKGPSRAVEEIRTTVKRRFFCWKHLLVLVVVVVVVVAAAAAVVCCLLFLQFSGPVFVRVDFPERGWWVRHVACC